MPSVRDMTQQKKQIVMAGNLFFIPDGVIVLSEILSLVLKDSCHESRAQVETLTCRLC